MNVKVNTEVRKWMEEQPQAARNKFNTKCTEAETDDFSTWRHIGGNPDIYDYNVSGDYRVVAILKNEEFNILAIYRHGEQRGKIRVCGQEVPGY